PFQAFVAPTRPCEGRTASCAAIDELELRGTFREGAVWTAMATVRGQRLTLHVGDALRDGHVLSVERDGVLFQKVTTDPLAPSPAFDVWLPLTVGSPLRVR